MVLFNGRRSVSARQGRKDERKCSKSFLKRHASGAHIADERRGHRGTGHKEGRARRIGRIYRDLRHREVPFYAERYHRHTPPANGTGRGNRFTGYTYTLRGVLGMTRF